MALPPAILALENQNIGIGGAPTLGQALELAFAEWSAGSRDRELRLHLLFLCWYCHIEPPYLTGFVDSNLPSTTLDETFQTVYATFSDQIDDDVECLYVVGLMASLGPWMLGEDVTTWEARSERFRLRYRTLMPQGLSLARFEGRGAYGDYFAHQVAVPGGF